MDRVTPDRRLSMTQQLVVDLTQQILAGELPAGSKLPTEQVIIKERGVSRTVVREAMSRLQAEGFVETRHGIGTFVVDTARPGDFQGEKHVKGGAYDALAVIELRLSLEVEAAGIAAQRATSEQLQAMREALDVANALDASDSESARRDFEFHLQVAQCTGNSFFIDAMTHVGNTLIAVVQQAGPAVTAENRALVIREREQVYAALARRDAEAARASMRLHLINMLQRIRSMTELTP
ncbi:FadR/GntR family transcriptional regulator [Pseudomonas sp. RGM2987]|uniref:FadR/GntR family transcriptional regulator n=1 Tax=Pseudomonas sp. RGM2987 TaxID=2930090 RepID=UPI001FD71D9F|nr:FadR/GntR family transcriptional regulator [Pseudomonas sp. RGM2987]MCJ8207062.1 FadR family transcriptional regulator [Pseudomonas sp. RGM2987]